MKRELTDREIWNTAWRGYRDTGSSRLSVREMDRYLASVLSRVPLSASVVELGGAPARIIARMHRIRPDLRYDCIDFSPVGLELARKLYEAWDINGGIIEADVMTYDRRLGTYDLVCSHGLVEHFEDVNGIVARHFEFAKPGGLVSITVPNFSVFPVVCLLRRFSAGTLETHNLECMSSLVLEAAVKSAGGVVLESGLAGAAILPCSSVSKGIGGCLYGVAARCWNLLNSLVGLATKDRCVMRLWRQMIYVLASKPG
ncbi:MAG: class I SAM-dependent methyltransferase [Armatimonadota bacterium]